MNPTIRSQRGIATIEATLVLPLLIFLTSVSVETGTAINQYLIASRVAYEGSRYAATVPGIIPGEPQASDCVIGAPGCNPAMMEVRKRITSILARHSITPDRFRLVTEATETTSDDGTKHVTVSIELGTVFDSSFLPLNLMPRILTTKITGPYLFPDRAA